MAGISYDRPTDGDLMTNAGFGGTNASPGTGVLGQNLATFTETAPTVLLLNTSGKDSASGGKFILPRYCRLICTVAPANGTDLNLVVTVDDINRYTSGGTQISLAGSRTDMLATAGIGKLYLGAIVSPAAGTNRKLVTRKVLKRSAPTVGDEFLINFSDTDDGVHEQLTGAALPQVFTCTTDGLALAPGAVNHSLLFYLWSTASTGAPSWEIEWGHIEKTT